MNDKARYSSAASILAALLLAGILACKPAGETSGVETVTPEMPGAELPPEETAPETNESPGGNAEDRQVRESIADALRKADSSGLDQPNLVSVSLYDKETIAALRDMFEKVDILVELISCRVTDVQGGTAEVRFVQNVRRVKGSPMRDYQVSGFHVLKKDKGKWKMFSTAGEDTMPL